LASNRESTGPPRMPAASFTRRTLRIVSNAQIKKTSRSVLHLGDVPRQRTTRCPTSAGKLTTVEANLPLVASLRRSCRQNTHVYYCGPSLSATQKCVPRSCSARLLIAGNEACCECRWTIQYFVRRSDTAVNAVRLEGWGTKAISTTKTRNPEGVWADHSRSREHG
jgi:hypothetical protein